MNELQIFNYGEIPVRTVLLDGEPWWVLADVCRVLGIKNSRDVVNRLDPDEKGVGQIDTPGGNQNMTIINESGLYKVILRSDKPEAKAFTRWVTHEVLPAIRKTGAYKVNAPAQRALVVDDYLTAARMVSNCRNERLAYVLALLKDAGFNIPEVQPPTLSLTDNGEYGRMTAIELGEALKNLLNEKHITQSELSRMTGIGKPSICQYLKGINKPPFERYTIIIEALM